MGWLTNQQPSSKEPNRAASLSQLNINAKAYYYYYFIVREESVDFNMLAGPHHDK